MPGIAIPAVTPIQVRLPDEERSALDTYRREQENPPSRAKAARELIRQALHERLNPIAAEART